MDYLKIRAAEAYDREAVLGMFARWPGHERSHYRFGFDGHHSHLVAELRGEVVGYASVTPDGWKQDQYPATRAMGGNWGFLADLLVTPELRSQGIGAMLVAAAEDVARDAGARGLGVNPDATGDRGALCRFYERCGFDPVWPHGESDLADMPYYYRLF